MIGAAGNEEGAESDFEDPQPDWSAKRASLFGFGKLVFESASVAKWQWMANEVMAIDEVGLHDLCRKFPPAPWKF